MKLYHDRARSFARTLWGDVNGSYRTNRPGCYYFVCAGHGGYIVDVEALTYEEYSQISKYIKPTLTSGVAFADGRIKMHNPFSVRERYIQYKPYIGDLVFETEIFVFEEDCDWAVLEALTDIRCSSSPPDEASQEVFNNHHVVSS